MANVVLSPEVGRWSFVIGLLIAVLVGLSVEIPGVAGVLFLLGILVGFLNVGERESSSFLISVIALLGVGVAGLQLGILTPIISNVLAQFVSFVSAAALVVALKQILTYARG